MSVADESWTTAVAGRQDVHNAACMRGTGEARAFTVIVREGGQNWRGRDQLARPGPLDALCRLDVRGVGCSLAGRCCGGPEAERQGEGGWWLAQREADARE